MPSNDRLLSRLSRRAFLRSTTSLAVLAQLRRVANATSMRRHDGFAYVACGEEMGGGDGSLRVFSMHGTRWAEIQCVPTRAPGCVVLSPDQQTLYVANRVGVDEGLPRGTVEAFRIDPANGRLRLLNRQALSLAATYPGHMALSPDGGLLAVAADGGSICNLLPLLADGRLDRPSSIFKQPDCAQRSGLRAEESSHRLLFDASGNHLFWSGFGDGRLRAFAVPQRSMSRRMQQQAVEIDDLGAWALHPDGSMLYVLHKTERGISCYRYDSTSGRVGEAVQRISMRGRYDGASSHGALAIDPAGRMLSTAETTRGQVQTWRIQAQDGLLSRPRHFEFDGRNGIVVASNDNLFVLERLRGAMRRITVDNLTGESGFVEDVATIPGAHSMVFKTLEPTGRDR